MAAFGAHARQASVNEPSGARLFSGFWVDIGQCAHDHGAQFELRLELALSQCRLSREHGGHVRSWIWKNFSSENTTRVRSKGCTPATAATRAATAEAAATTQEQQRYETEKKNDNNTRQRRNDHNRDNGRPRRREEERRGEGEKRRGER